MSAFPANPHRVSAGRVIMASMLLASTAFIPASASAQLRGLGRRASEAVERKANQKIDQKIDQAAQKLVDRSFDSVFGSIEGGASDGSGGNSSGRVFSLLPNAPTEDRYDFDAVLTYELESTRKGKKSDDKSLIVMHFNSDGKYTGARIASADPKKDDTEIFAIFDIKNESMVMLMTSDKQKMSMAYSWKDAQRYAAQTSTTAPSGSGAAPTTTAAANGQTMTFSSLGKRTIAGYNAEGYKGVNQDGDEVEVWVSNDPALPYGRMMGASASMKQMRGMMSAGYPTGMLMEVTSLDKKSGDTGRMTVKSVNTKANVHVDMSDYPRIGQEKK